ncbi:MAG: hypothetical protein ACOC91_00575 [bacterium]
MERTATVRKLIELIGDEKTKLVLTAFGGQVVTIGRHPEKASPDNLLAALVGPERYARLCIEYGPGKIYVPLVWRRSKYREAILREKGSAREVAAKIGCCERTVNRARKWAREQGIGDERV